MVDLNFTNIAIIGTGLLGGSVGLALRRSGFGGRLIGTGSRPATLEKAQAAGCVDHITTDLSEAVSGSDLILLAAPVGAIPDLLGRLAESINGQAIITDVGSTKANIVAAAERSLRRPERFVGSHPMAGAETTGPESARADLFEGKPVILTPTQVTDPQAGARVEELWRALGMQVHRMSPAEHDRLVAIISHVPHAAAVLLVRLAAEGGALPVASTGFADMTRLAGGDPSLWADIFLDNRQAVLAALGRLTEMTEDFRRIIQSADREKLLDLLAETQSTRQAWRGKAKGVA